MILPSASDVATALAQAGKPQTARRIADTLGYGPGLKVTTVIRRVLEHMEADGLVRRLHTTGRAWAWELEAQHDAT